MSVYQIATFASGNTPLVNTLRETLRRHFTELGIPSDMLVFLDIATVLSRDQKSPTVGVYFGIAATSPTATAELAGLISEGVMVVPVVPTTDGYTAYVPEELKATNGMALRAEDATLEGVAGVLLEGLGLLRKNRRLFISYRRIETQSIAIQLYELLDTHGFDVFLDTHSVRPGEPFQEVLWHRLADTDVVVLLDSPGFLDSRWTEEELARANSTNLQILQLTWPGSSLTAPAAFSVPFSLSTSDFVSPLDLVGTNARLKESCLKQLAVEVESLRARALAARHSYLVQEFFAEATSAGFSPQVQPERFILLKTKTNKYYITVPTVGVPDALRYQEVEDEVSQHPKRHSEVILLYDERGIRDKWMKHLAWLDRQNLPVRSLQVAKAQDWLGGLT